MIVTAGSTNVSVYYYIVQDASGTSPGEPVTGLLFSDIETGGSASYARQGSARVDLTLITLASASATHADGGFILVDDTNMPGLYRCDYPDAAFATGIDQVFLQIVVASANNAVAAPILVDITDVDLRDATSAGISRIDAAITTRLAPTVAARTLDVTTGGAAGLDWGNIENQGATVDLSATDFQLVDTCTANTDMRGTDSALLAASAPSNWSSMVISGAGAVDGLVQGFINSTLTESSVARINNNFEFFYDNADAQTAQVVDDVGGGGGGTDWTASERNEIRGRLGVTGTTAAGGNTPTLAIQSDLTLVLSDTNAIKVKTDQMVYTVANQLDTNMLTHTATIPANYITAAGIAANAMDNKGNWNIGKTGYLKAISPCQLH